MKSFSYVIKDSIGIHARPAGLLCKTAKSLDSEVIIKKGGDEFSAVRLMALMGAGIKCGDEVEVIITGGNEEKSFEVMKEFFEKNL